MRNFSLRYPFVFLILFGASLSLQAQSNGLIYNKVVPGSTFSIKLLKDSSGYAVAYRGILYLDSLDIGIWQNEPHSLTVDSVHFNSCVVLYNSNFEPLGKVLTKGSYIAYPLTNTEVILHYLNYNLYQGLVTTFPSAANFQGLPFGEGTYLRYNSLDQSVNGLSYYGLPSLPSYYNDYPYRNFFPAIFGNDSPSNIASLMGNTSAILNNNILIGYYQLFSQQTLNDSLEFSPWGDQVNLLRIKMNLDSGEIGVDQIGSSSGSLVPFSVQATNDGDGLYYAGAVRGNNTPVSVSGAEVDMAPNDSLYHVYITKESASGESEWLTQLYAYNNVSDDTSSLYRMYMSTSVFSILEKDENLFVSTSFNGFISNEDTLMYRDFTGESMLLSDTIPYYGSFDMVQIPIAESSIYKMNTDGNLIGKLSYTPQIFSYYNSTNTGWIDKASRLFEVGDKLAWVQNYYSATNISISFTYKNMDGSTQNSSIDLPAGKGTFILWLDVNLNILDYWLFPYTSNKIAGINNFNYIGQYSGDTLLIQGNLSPLSSININPFGSDSIIETTESTNTKTYFAFYSAPEILTNTPSIEGLPSLSVFPNPTQDALHISGVVTEYGRYRIFDISGRMVQSGMLNSELVVNTSRLKSGMYILRIDTEKSNGSRKFVVK